MRGSQNTKHTLMILYQQCSHNAEHIGDVSHGICPNVVTCLMVSALMW
jgi:hypothetical protein